MSVLAAVRGSEDAARLVSVEGMQSVGELLQAVHAALELPRAREDYNFVVGADAAVLAGDEDSSLEALGVMGGEEHISVALRFSAIVRDQLAEEGITTAAHGAAAIRNALAATDCRWFDTMWEKARLVHAAELAPLAPHLRRAAGDGNLPAVRKLLELGADADAMGGYRPLALAAASGHTEVIEVLLEHGAVLDAQGDKDNGPLFVAVHSNHWETLRSLLARGADVNAEDHEGRSPLHHAVQFRACRAVVLLVAAGADLEHMGGDPPETALHAAVKCGAVDCARLLLKAGCAVNPEDGRGRTPLLWACEGGHAALVELLATHGARVDAAGGDGVSPAVDETSAPPPAPVLPHGWQSSRARRDPGADIFVPAL